MSFFGISLLDDVDLPEFPFPDLRSLANEDDPPQGGRGPSRRANGAETDSARRARPDRRYN